MLFFIELLSKQTWTVDPTIDNFKKTLLKRLFKYGYFPKFINEFDLVPTKCTGGWIQALSAHLKDYKSQVVWYDGSDDAKNELVNSVSKDSIFLISIRSLDYPLAKEVIQIIKKQNPQAKVIVGGVHPTVNPFHTYADLKPDCLVCGEADHFIRPLVDYLSGKTGEFSKVPQNSVIFSENKISDITPAIAPISTIKMSWHLHYKYTEGMYKYVPSIMCTRDCPFHCRFCSIVQKRPFKKLRYVPIKDVIGYIKDLQEISNFRRYQIHVMFDDPTFLANKSYVWGLVEELKKMDITWECQTRIEKPTLEIKKLFREMRTSGCKSIYFGIESTDQYVQKVIGKNLNVKYILPMLKMAREEGLIVTTGWIVGLPFQTKESVHRDLDFICKCIDEDIIVGADYYFLTIYPGTEFYKNPQKYGLKIYSDFQSKYIDYRVLHDTSELTHNEIWEIYVKGCKILAEVMDK